MNRRSIIKWLGLTAGAATLPGSGSAAALVRPRKPSGAARALRVAHLTDIHIQPEEDAPRKFAHALAALQSLSDPPELILDGGDTIMDAAGVDDKARIERQWAVRNSILGQDNTLPVRHCIGNHDIWMAGPKSDPLFGKQYAMDKMELDRPYYSFDRKGWHFVILDSVSFGAGGYIGRFDDEQLEWLQGDLDRLDPATPVLFVSHIPILTATGFYPENAQEDGNWKVPGSWMHIDFQRVRALFARTPNPKVCLSGHMHLLDHVVYDEVHYLCNGAVCGNWWGSPTYHQTTAGFAILDLYADGSFDREYVTYDWG